MAIEGELTHMDMLDTIVEDANRWLKLISLCGSLHNGSQVTVSLWQDDATGCVEIKVGTERFSGKDFNSTIDSIPESV